MSESASNTGTLSTRFQSRLSRTSYNPMMRKDNIPVAMAPIRPTQSHESRLETKKSTASQESTNSVETPPNKLFKAVVKASSQVIGNQPNESKDAVSSAMFYSPAKSSKGLYGRPSNSTIRKPSATSPPSSLSTASSISLDASQNSPSKNDVSEPIPPPQTEQPQEEEVTKEVSSIEDVNVDVPNDATPKIQVVEEVVELLGESQYSVTEEVEDFAVKETTPIIHPQMDASVTIEEEDEDEKSLVEDLTEHVEDIDESDLVQPLSGNEEHTDTEKNNTSDALSTDQQDESITTLDEIEDENLETIESIHTTIPVPHSPIKRRVSTSSGAVSVPSVSKFPRINSTNPQEASAMSNNSIKSTPFSLDGLNLIPVAMDLQRTVADHFQQYEASLKELSLAMEKQVNGFVESHSKMKQRANEAFLAKLGQFD